MIVLVTHDRTNVILRLSDEGSRRTSTYDSLTAEALSTNLFDVAYKLSTVNFSCH